jgi:lycopene cyclase domain-containing protein
MEQVLTKEKTLMSYWLGRLSLIITPLVLVAIQWSSYEKLTEDMIYDVPITRLIPVLETSYLYLLILVASFLSVFLLSFDKRVAYYKTWKYLIPATLIVGSIFVAWDIAFTEMYVWRFNSDYYMGIRFLGLPFEEWLFFFIIPFCSIVIYESLNYYVKKDVFAQAENLISMILITALLIGGFAFWDKIYTSTTFLLTGAFLFYHVLFLDGRYRSRFYFSFLFILIPFLAVDGILTGGYTKAPIVLYNPEEYLNFRILSIPFEDMVYGFLMLLAIVTIVEYWKNKKIF